VAPPDVLDEGVAAGHDDDRPGPCQTPHRPQPGFGPGVVGLHSIVGYWSLTWPASGSSSSMSSSPTNETSPPPGASPRRPCHTRAVPPRSTPTGPTRPSSTSCYPTPATSATNTPTIEWSPTTPGPSSS
jgi:hypothetical protein